MPKLTNESNSDNEQFLTEIIDYKNEKQNKSIINKKVKKIIMIHLYLLINILNKTFNILYRNNRINFLFK